jgi:hypothetical protein
MRRESMSSTTIIWTSGTAALLWGAECTKTFRHGALQQYTMLTSGEVACVVCCLDGHLVQVPVASTNQDSTRLCFAWAVFLLMH